MISEKCLFFIVNREELAKKIMNSKYLGPKNNE